MPVLGGDRIVAALRGAFAREIGRQAMLALAAERIRAAGAPYTSVYMYMLHGDELVLEAWDGREDPLLWRSQQRQVARYATHVSVEAFGQCHSSVSTSPPAWPADFTERALLRGSAVQTALRHSRVSLSYVHADRPYPLAARTRFVRLA